MNAMRCICTALLFGCGAVFGSISVKVRSYEALNQQGVVDLSFEYTVLTEPATLSTPVFSLPKGYTLNGALPTGQLAIGTYVYTVRVNYPSTNLPFYPVSINVFSTTDAENSYSAEARLYFTPYGSTEVWDVDDFFNLSRSWYSDTDTPKQRIFIPKELIPVSNVDARWSGDVTYREVEGLAYAIPMKGDAQLRLSTPPNLSQIAEKDGCFASKRYRGNMKGRVMADFNIDNQGGIRTLPLEGLVVEIAEWDRGNIRNVISSGTTDANGYFNIWIDRCAINKLELVAVIKAQNKEYDIKGFHTLFNLEPDQMRTSKRDFTATGTGSRDLDFGTQYVNNDAHRAVHLAKRAWDFSTRVGRVSLPGGLIIRTRQAETYYSKLINHVIHVGRDRGNSEGGVLHEFGHFLMHHLQGGKSSNAQATSGSHAYGDDLNPLLAWSEGWANGFEAIVDAHYHDWDNESRFDLENNHENLIDRFLVNDGINSEYHIACALLDLWDGPNNYSHLRAPIPSFDDAGFWQRGFRDDVELPFADFCAVIREGTPTGLNGVITTVQDFVEKLSAKYWCGMKQNIKKTLDQNRVVANNQAFPDGNYDGLNTDVIFRSNNQLVAGTGFAITLSRNKDVNTLRGPSDNFNISSSAGYVPLSDKLTVLSGASLFVNNINVPMGFVNSSNQLAYNLAGQSVEICEGNFIDIYGNMEIGSSNTTYFGVVYVNDRAVLRLNSGSELSVKHTSKIVVMPGGTLIIENGAKATISGGIIVEPGGYLCIRTTDLPAGRKGVVMSTGAVWGANPVLGLDLNSNDCVFSRNSLRTTTEASSVETTSLVYPNPTNGSIYTHNSRIIMVTNSIGELVYQGDTETLSLEKGLYVVHIESENGMIYTEKIVVE